MIDMSSIKQKKKYSLNNHIPNTFYIFKTKIKLTLRIETTVLQIITKKWLCHEQNRTKIEPEDTEYA